MCCSALVLDGRTIGYVCSKTGTVERVPSARRKRSWCFKCRRRLLHTLMRLDPGPDSYYGPSYWWQCPSCHEEHVLFPGREWEYER